MIVAAKATHGPPTSLAAAPAPLGFQAERLLVIDPLTRRFGDFRIHELPGLLGHGDVLVLNDAATLPASVRVDTELELRLVAAEEDGSFQAVTFGGGDFRQATEARGAPRALREQERLTVAPDLSARVVAVDAVHPRLVRLRFEQIGAALWAALYRHAAPIQYAYVPQRLRLWDVQNRYAARPWAFELPSAGRPLTFQILFEVEKRGAAIAYVTHAAGISSTGDAGLDARLPLPEHYEISPEALGILERGRQQHGRVIAVGTSTVRALEGSARSRAGLSAGGGTTDLRLDRNSEPRVVDGLLTGLHEPQTSHFELLEAFAPRSLLLRATDHAGRMGYLQHEFGDACLLLPGALL